MKPFSRSGLKRRKKRDKRNIFRALFIFMIFSSVNIVFNIIVDRPKNAVPFILGIFLPLFYAVFYFITKRIKYKHKIQSNSYIITPFFYLLFGAIWYLLFSIIGTFTSIKLEAIPNGKTNNYKASIDGNKDSEGELKAFFFYEDYLCRAASVPSLLIKHNCENNRGIKLNVDCSQFKKSTTNKTTSFVILFISQIIIIFISENIIYPLVKKKFILPKNTENIKSNN